MSKIKYKTGNILDEEAEALVNTVNCIGFMGRGIALDFKKAFPENFDAYAVRCKNGKMNPKKVFVFETDKKKGNLRFDFGKKAQGTSALHYQFSDQAALAGQKQNRGY